LGFRDLAAATASAAIALTSTATAQAAQRYAAPNGLGSQCTQAQPCALSTALSGAQASEEVIIAGNAGSYGTEGSPLTSLSTASSAYFVRIHGAAGQSRPVIFTSGGLSTFCSVSGQCPSVSGVDIELTSAGTALSAYGKVDHVIARARGGGEGCQVSGVSSPEPPQQILDSVCAADGIGNGLLLTSDYGGSQTAGLVLRNDTILAGGGSSRGLTVDITSTSGSVILDVAATNVIARGGVEDVVASATNSGGSATVNVSLDHSNFSTNKTEGSGTANVTSGVGDQKTNPTFIDPAAGNFHEASGSPTIDGGVNDLSSGETDLDGNPRALPSGLTCSDPGPPAITDIGAYEFVPIAPPCPPPAPPDTSITKTGVRKQKRNARFSFDAIGTANGFECELIKPIRKHHRRLPATFSSCASPKVYKHLTPGRYAFEVRAFDSGGPDPTPAIRRFKI
jgi:hypothetical protein